MTKRVKYIFGFFVVAMLACCAGEAYGQHYFGVRGGYGGGNASRTYPSRYAEQGTLWGLYHGGISWKYYTRQKYVGGTQVDILYMQQALKEYDESYSLAYFPGDSSDPNNIIPGDTTGYYSRKVNSIVVPLMWQPHVYLFNRNMRVFLNAGVTFSYNMSSTYEIGSKQNGVFESDKYDMRLERDNRWGYGLVAGAGLGYSVGRIEAVAEFRYYIGYSDIRKNWNKYWDSDRMRNQLRSPLDGLQGSIAIYYRIGKKGILSPPSPKVEQKLREIEEKRLRKKGLLPDELEPEELFDPDTGEALTGEDNVIAPEEMEDTVPETAPEDVPQDIPEVGDGSIMAAVAR